MKTILSILLFSLITLTSYTQCNDIMISEVVEGWSNNKAIEIYNPTSQTIDLTDYGVVRFQNGSTTYGNISYLDGLSVASHDVLVIVLDKRDQNGTGLEYPIWDELQAAGDVFINPTYDNGVWAMYFNGNDAIAIVKNNGQTLVDLFGRIGEGTGFGGWSVYATDTLGDPVFASEDHTMIRKQNVQNGITQNPQSFSVFAEYDTLPANTFTQLGFHICDCGSTDVESNDINFNIYPNPSNDQVNIISSGIIGDLIIYDLSGKIVTIKRNINDKFLVLDITDLSSGSYYLDIKMVNGLELRKKLIK